MLVYFAKMTLNAGTISSLAVRSQKSYGVASFQFMKSIGRAWIGSLSSLGQ